MAKEKKVKLGKHGFAKEDMNFSIMGEIESIKFDNTPTGTGREQNKMTVGVKTRNNNTVYVDFKGMVKDKAHLYSKAESKTVVVEWKDRNKEYEGCNIMGITYSINEKENKTEFEYDAVGHMKDIFKKGDIVRVIGKIESNTNDGKTYTTVAGNKIYFSTSKIEFDSETFEEENKFFGKIVIMEKTKDKDSDGNKMLNVSSKIITNDSAENFTFSIKDEKLAINFEKLKNYTAISIEGKIENSVELKEVETDDDGWGASKVIQKSTKKEFVVYYANRDSIDKETFDEDAIDKIMSTKNATKKAEDDFGVSKKASSDDINW